MRDRRHQPEEEHGIPDGLLVGLLAFLLGLTLLVWTATGLAGLLSHGAWPTGVTFANTPLAMRALVSKPHDLVSAWPETPSAELSGYGLFWGLAIGELMVLVVLTIFALGTLTRWRAVRRSRAAGRGFPAEAWESPARPRRGSRRGAIGGEAGWERDTSGGVAGPSPTSGTTGTHAGNAQRSGLHEHDQSGTRRTGADAYAGSAPEPGARATGEAGRPAPTAGSGAAAGSYHGNPQPQQPGEHDRSGTRGQGADAYSANAQQPGARPESSHGEAGWEQDPAGSGTSPISAPDAAVGGAAATGAYAAGTQEPGSGAPCDAAWPSPAAGSGAAVGPNSLAEQGAGGRDHHAAHGTGAAGVPAPRTRPARLLYGDPATRRPSTVQAVFDAQGPVLVVTSDPTVWAETKDARAKLGPVLVYDPGHLCDTPARLHWSPSAHCEDPTTAQARATALLAPVRPRALLDAAMADTAETLLRCWLHAAAVDGRPFKQLHRWAQGGNAHDAVRILRTHPKATAGLAGLLESALTAHAERREIAQQLVVRALSSLSSIHIREACTPNRADSLTLESFISEGGSLYLVGEPIEDPRTHPGAMPLLTALASDVVEHGRRMAARSSDGRLDPPMTLVLDDVAAVAPLPRLPELLATGQDQGLPTLVLLRSAEQARARWPEPLPQ
ncbi:type VI secretion protein [Streptomyces sp. NPDC005408]|uniref:type VI secretion protein n=1 Tax=Streptomyces sp. NPDC005408 TaxID=3155341 RepID=UPI0033AF7A53